MKPMPLIVAVLALFIAPVTAFPQAPPPVLLECGDMLEVQTLAAGQTSDHFVQWTAGQRVRVEFQAGPGFQWNPHVRVYTSAGFQLEQVNDFKEFTAFATDVYRLEVRDGFANGYGSLRLRWQSILPAQCADTLVCGSRVDGAIPGPHFRSFYTFQGEQGDWVALVLQKRNVAGAPWNPGLRVYSPTGVEFQAFDSGANAQHEFRLPANGWYTVTVGDIGLGGPDGWGAFSLSLDWIYPVERMCAPELFCGEKSSGRTTHGGDRSIRRFEGTQGDIVHFDLMREPAPWFDPILELYMSGLSLPIAKFQGFEDVLLPATGSYTVVIHDVNWDGFGTWMLDIEWAYPFEKSCAPQLSDCTPVGGLTRASEDAEFFQFQGVAGETVQLDAIRGPGKLFWAPQLRLFRPTALLQEVQPLAGGKQFVLPLTGIYTVAVKDVANNSSGSFQVRLQRPPFNCPEPVLPGCAGKRITFVDLNAPEFEALPFDSAVLATGGREVVALAADGVTPVLLRVEGLTGPGNVSLRVADDVDSTVAESVGSLADALTGTTGNPLVVPLVYDAASGQWQAFAQLTSPLNFSRGPHDGEAAVRKLTVVASGSNGACSSGELLLMRPPVVLVHGLFGQSESWRWPSLDRAGGSGFLVNGRPLPQHVYLHDYRLTNADGLEQNIGLVRHGIASALRSFRGFDATEHAFVAATQADVVTHSYGSVITRHYAADVDGSYYRADNRLMGDIHKLITLGGPHSGSPWADLVTSFVSWPVLGDTFAALTEEIGLCMDCGGVSALQVDEFDLVPGAPVPIHAVYGTGASDLIASGSGAPATVFEDEVTTVIDWLAWAYKLSSLDLSQLLFGTEPHDMLVDAASAQAGLAPAHTTHVEGLDGVHTYMQKSWRVEGLVSRLLSEPLDPSDPLAAFASYIPPGPGVTDFVPPFAALSIAGFALPPINLALPGLLELVPLFPTASWGEGDLVPVEVRGVGTFQPERVAVLAGSEVFLRDEEPYVVFVRVPANAVGVVPIYGMALDAGYNLAMGAELFISVNPFPGVASVYATPDPLFLTLHDPSIQLGVRAVYNDGSLRYLDPDDPGLSFVAVSGSVAAVDGEGHVSAVAPGETTVRVGYGGKLAQVPVHVVTDEGDDGSRALALRRDLSGNVGSLQLSGSQGGRPVLGASITLRLDLAATGHASGVVFLHVDPLHYPVPGGQALGVDLRSPASLVFPVLPGADSYSHSLGSSPVMIGLRLSAQGIHFGAAPSSAPSLAFSNVWDFRIGDH